MRLALIWAQSENGVIGRGGRLPWRLPKEMAYFRRATLGKPVIMGRRTFESLDGPLPQRTNIVLTRREEFAAPGVKTARSFEDALTVAESVAHIDTVDEAVVIGGADVYAQALPIADRLYVTLVHAELEGDTFMPSFEASDWVLQHSECVAADENNSHAFTSKLFERKT